MRCVHSIMQICAHSPTSALPPPLPRNSDGLLVDKIEADDDPYATVACYFT
jgi:hypothetical protein